VGILLCARVHMIVKAVLCLGCKNILSVGLKFVKHTCIVNLKKLI